MYPVILAHGFFGFEKIAGIEYFRGIKKYLNRKFPEVKVHITEVEPNDPLEKRAEQIWSQVESLGDKIHLIGHSMGGLDARYLASPHGLDKGERIYSVTTLSSPHHGSPVADFIIDKREKFEATEIDDIINRLPLTRLVKKIIKELKKRGEVWNYLLELLDFTEKGMTNLTTYYLEQFNQECIDAPTVKYFSYAGVTGPNEKDYLPPVMYLTWAIIFLYADSRTGGRNDGLVAVNSSAWGTFKGEIPADHFKIVGWDLSGWGWLKKLFPCLRIFNHRKFFEKIVNDLRDLEKKAV